MQQKTHNNDTKKLMFGRSVEDRAMWNAPISHSRPITISFMRNTGSKNGNFPAKVTQIERHTVDTERTPKLEY